MAIDYLKVKDINCISHIQPSDWGSITGIHEYYLKLNNCSCIKKIDLDNNLLGIGTAIDFKGTGWLAHIIVGQKYQKQGVGSLVVRNRMDYLLNNCGSKTITLNATEQGFPVYKKIGFKEQSFYYILQREKNLEYKAVESENIVSINKSHYKEIESIDMVTSGELRMDFLRPVLDSGYVYINKGVVEGFYLPKLGDGGIFAKTEDAGIMLLNKHINTTSKVVVPLENKIAFDYLIKNGFKEIKKISRMIYGNEFAYRPEYCYSRIGGFVG